jgi:hypothetical protein
MCLFSVSPTLIMWAQLAYPCQSHHISAESFVMWQLRGTQIWLDFPCRPHVSSHLFPFLFPLNMNITNILNMWLPPASLLYPHHIPCPPRCCSSPLFHRLIVMLVCHGLAIPCIERDTSTRSLVKQGTIQLLQFFLIECKVLSGSCPAQLVV